MEGQNFCEIIRIHNFFNESNQYLEVGSEYFFLLPKTLGLGSSSCGLFKGTVHRFYMGLGMATVLQRFTFFFPCGRYGELKVSRRGWTDP